MMTWSGQGFILLTCVTIVGEVCPLPVTFPKILSVCTPPACTWDGGEAGRVLEMFSRMEGLPGHACLPFIKEMIAITTLGRPFYPLRWVLSFWRKWFIGVKKIILYLQFISHFHTATPFILCVKTSSRFLGILVMLNYLLSHIICFRYETQWTS